LPGIVPPEPVQRGLPGIPASSPSQKRFQALGKQVLFEGAHYADAVHPDAANCIVDALNGADEQASWSTIIAQMK
jgi:hypothetical protein